MALDLIALTVLVVFAGLGAWRGGLATGAGVMTLVVSYGAAALGAQQLGAPVGARLGSASILGPVVAGTAVFLLAFAVLGVVSKILLRWDRGRLGDEPRTACDRLAGALFGLVRGGLVVLLLSILVTWLDAARDMGLVEGLGLVPQTERSAVGEATSRVVEGAVSAALGEDEDSPGGRVMARVAARPGVALESFRAVMEDERLQAVQHDKMFWILVENGAGERAINQASFYPIVHDEAMRTQLADLGLVSAEAAADPEAFRRTMAATLTEIGPVVAELRNDPELQELASDPEIRALVESGDTLALMGRPEIRRIVGRVTAAR